ncbi:hypothetical protein [Streptomyces longispororuber]|nr:hypothetical protein [Streptomyces longispororuber]
MTVELCTAIAAHPSREGPGKPMFGMLVPPTTEDLSTQATASTPGTVF